MCLLYMDSHLACHAHSVLAAFKLVAVTAQGHKKSAIKGMSQQPTALDVALLLSRGTSVLVELGIGF